MGDCLDHMQSSVGVMCCWIKGACACPICAKRSGLHCHLATQYTATGLQVLGYTATGLHRYGHWASTGLQPLHQATQLVSTVGLYGQGCTAVQGCTVTRLHSYRAAQLGPLLHMGLSCGAVRTRLHSYKVAQLQGCTVTRLHSYRAAQLWDYTATAYEAALWGCTDKAAQLQGCTVTRLHSYGYTITAWVPLLLAAHADTKQHAQLWGYTVHSQDATQPRRGYIHRAAGSLVTILVAV